MGGVRLLLAVVCLWLPQIVEGGSHIQASVVMNMYTDAACTEVFTGEPGRAFKQSADDKTCWNMGGDSFQAKCAVDGKLDVQIWWNKAGTPTAPKCTGTPSSASSEWHLNGLTRATAMAFFTGGGCMKQPATYCDSSDKRNGVACYMYTKLATSLPADGLPSACMPPTTTAGDTDASAAPAKTILGVSGGGLAASLALWF